MVTRRSRRVAPVVLMAASLVAAGAVLPAAATADSLRLFNGTYKAVRQSVNKPDQVSVWIVGSSCSMLGCVAHVVSDSLRSFDMVSHGSQWVRVAIPMTGSCNGVTVPAMAAEEYLIPRADGSLSGATASTVNCDGRTVESKQSITVVPA